MTTKPRSANAVVEASAFLGESMFNEAFRARARLEQVLDAVGSSILPGQSGAGEEVRVFAATSEGHLAIQGWVESCAGALSSLKVASDMLASHPDLLEANDLWAFVAAVHDAEQSLTQHVERASSGA